MICKHKDKTNQRCNEWALTIPDKSKPSETIKMPNGGPNVSWPTMPTKHGLCYYHHKDFLGLFEEKDKRYQWFLDALDGRYGRR